MIEKMGEEDIKKRWNIYLYYWTIPVFIVFFIINYFTRNFMIEALNINLMISVVSFLFGFLITITFSMLLNRVSALKDALAIEAGRLVSLYHLSKNLGKEFHEKITQRIDDYTVNTLRDYTNYDISREAMYGIYSDLQYAQVEDKKQEGNYGSFLYILGEFETLRERLEYLTSRRVEWSLKAAGYMLGSILMILLFLNRGDTFSNTLFILLSTIIVFIFLIIEDYDNLRIGDYTYNISNSEQIFDLIGKERYYPKEVLSKARLIFGETYRIGILDKKTNKEKMVNIKYNPTLKSKIEFLKGKFKGR